MRISEILEEKLQAESLQSSTKFAAVGLNLKAEATLPVQERIEVIWSRFNPSTVDELQMLITLLQTFSVHFTDQSDKQFLYKLHVIAKFIEVHGETVFELNPTKLEALSELYSSLGAELPSLTLESLEILQDFSALMPSISKQQCSKLIFIFKELSIDKLSKWTMHTLGNLRFVLNEFGIDLPHITKLELESKISDIRELGLWNDSLPVTQARIEFIKSIKSNLAALNPLEVSKIKALLQALSFNELRPAVSSWFTSKFDFRFKNLNETTFVAIKAVQNKLQTATGKALTDISEVDINKVETLLAALGEQILIITLEKIKIIAKAIPFSSIGAVSSDLIDVLKAFKLDIMKADAEFKNVRMFLASFGIELIALSAYEASNLARTIQSFGGLNSKAVLTETLSTFGYSLLNIDETELSKLGLMAKIVGVPKLLDLKSYNLKHMKIISDSLNFKLSIVDESDLQHLQSLLNKLKFQDTAKEQGWFSYLTKGAEAALQSKLDEIKNKILALGGSIFAFDYDNAEAFLAHFGKSFITATIEELSNLTKALQIFGFDLHNGYSYQINSAIALFKTFSVDPFAISKIEAANLKLLFSGPEGLDSSEIAFMKQVLDNYSIRISEEGKLQELKSNLFKLGLSLDIEHREALTQIMKFTGPDLVKLPLLVEFAPNFQANPEVVLEYVSLFDVKSKDLMIEVHNACVNFTQPIDDGMKQRITSAVESCNPEENCPVIGDLVKQVCETN